MKTSNEASAFFVMAVAFLFGLTGSVNAAMQVDLGTADNFAILSGTPNITDAGNASTITGDVGLSPATAASIGLWCSQMSGVSTIYGVDAGYLGGGFGTLCFKGTAPDKTLVDKAKTDLGTAYDDASGQGPGTIIDTELGGQTLSPGVYSSASTTFQLTAGAGHLVLDGQGDSDAVFIFEMNSDATGLTVGPDGAEVELIGSAQACNVFWRVNTATIDTTAVFAGNILALTSITVANGATIDGSLLARNGNVTLDHNTITNAVCKAPDDSSYDIKVTKSASKTALKSGPDKVTFTYKVTNEGNAVLTDISVKDDKCDDVNYVSGDDNDNDELDTDEEWKYTCKKTVKKTETNTVTAKGYANGEEFEDTDTVKVTVSTPGLPAAGVGSDENFWDIISWKLISFFSF